MTNEKAIYIIRYNIARYTILLGIKIMPDSLYKSLLMLRLYELRQEMDDMLKQAKELQNGDKREEYEDL